LNSHNTLLRKYNVKAVSSKVQVPKSKFSEHASNNNPSLKHLVKKREKMIVSVIFGSSLAVAKFLFDVSIPLFFQVPIRYKDKQW